MHTPHTSHISQVDTEGFEREMGAQRARSKESREEVDLTAQGALAALAPVVGPTQVRVMLFGACCCVCVPVRRVCLVFLVARCVSHGQPPAVCSVSCTIGHSCCTVSPRSPPLPLPPVTDLLPAAGCTGHTHAVHGVRGAVWRG